eukprot:2567012-Pleurochrysis_carterae.AAC.2
MLRVFLCASAAVWLRLRGTSSTPPSEAPRYPDGDQRWGASGHRSVDIPDEANGGEEGEGVYFLLPSSS